MKKNLALRLGAVVLVMSVITLSLVAGTFAKYTKGVTGAETVRAAEFAFELNDGTTTYNELQTLEAAFNIFDYTDSGVFADGNNGEEFIAPGTTGSFNLDVTNLSEVDAEVAFKLSETNDGDIPVYYTVSGASQRYSNVLTGTYNGSPVAPDTGAYLSLSALSGALPDTLEANDGDGSDGTAIPAESTGTITLAWAWLFENSVGDLTTNDAADTAIGTAATLPTVKLAVTATVTQVD